MQRIFASTAEARLRMFALGFTVAAIVLPVKIAVAQGEAASGASGGCGLCFAGPTEYCGHMSGYHYENRNWPGGFANLATSYCHYVGELCSDAHPECAAEAMKVGDEIAAAVARNDLDGVRSRVSQHGISLNVARGAIQVRGCDGKTVAMHIPVTPVQLLALNDLRSPRTTLVASARSDMPRALSILNGAYTQLSR